MKTYQGSEIRNVAVVGHAHSGKTTLIAALLHAAKMTPTQGRVEDGSAATAYDEEEVARGITMQNAVAYAEWQGTKINFVNTPGFHMFTHEARAALFPVESAIVVVNAQSGVEPVTERVWKFAEEANVPRIVLVNQMDNPKAGGEGGLNALLDNLTERWGRNCVPVQLPISDANGFHGVVDLVTMQAYTYTPGGLWSVGRIDRDRKVPTRIVRFVELHMAGVDDMHSRPTRGRWARRSRSKRGRKNPCAAGQWSTRTIRSEPTGSSMISVRHGSRMKYSRSGGKGMREKTDRLDRGRSSRSILGTSRSWESWTQTIAPLAAARAAALANRRLTST